VHYVRKTHTERLGNALSAEALGVARACLAEDGAGSLCSALAWALSDEAWSAAQKLSRELQRFRGDAAIAAAALARARYA
jgi:hypothetical protein